MPEPTRRSNKQHKGPAAEIGQSLAERDPDTLLTVQEAGDYLRLSDRRVLELCKSGALVSHRVGNLFRIRWGDVRALLAATKVGKPTEPKEAA